MSYSKLSHEDEIQLRQGDLLPLTALYDATSYTIHDHPNLKKALEKLGELPVDPTGRRIPSSMHQYGGGVTNVRGYFYPHADRKIYRENEERVSSWMRESIVIEIGIGDEEGAEKTWEIIGRIPEKERPVLFIPNDLLADNTRTAKKMFRRFGFPEKRTRAVTGDIFDSNTWKAINANISGINKELNPKHPFSVVVLIQGPWFLNNTTDAQAAKIQDHVFGLDSHNIILAAGIDGTPAIGIDGKPGGLLGPAYNNPKPLQFVLTAVYGHCLRNRIPFNPLDESIRANIRSESADLSTIQYVIEGPRRFEVDAIRKMSTDLVKRKLAEDLEERKRKKMPDQRMTSWLPIMKYNGEGEFSEAKYAVVPLMRPGPLTYQR